MKYDVFGIGNALVDMEFTVTDDFIKDNNIEKGLMTLVEEDAQNKLMGALISSNGEHFKRQCGGSAANSIIAVSQLGGKSFYAFKVAGDETGEFYLTDMNDNGVETKNSKTNLPQGTTGKCMVMVSPDAERTMHTYLGITASLDDEQIDEAALRDSKWLYVEGYLVASPTGQVAAMKAIELAKSFGVKTSLTMSDPNMVSFFKDNMSALIGNGVDLIFCNEIEAFSFTDTENLDEAMDKLKKFASSFVITRGNEGAVIWDGEKRIDIRAFETKAIDSNGAGDMFAGAFLFGVTNGLSFEQAGTLASLASSKVVSQFGPRLVKSQMDEILKKHGEL